MKSVFIDTNILIDLLANREPFHKYALQLFSKAEKKQIKIYCSSHTIATSYYILKKYSEEKPLRELINGLFNFVTVLPVDLDILKKSLQSKYKDFEDAIQINCALSIKIDCIITRNIKAFKGCPIEVIAPDQFVA